MTREANHETRVAMSETKAEAIQKIKDHIAGFKFTKLLVVGILDDTDPEAVDDSSTVVVASSESPVGTALLMMKAVDGLDKSRADLGGMLDAAMSKAKADAEAKAEAEPGA